MPFTDTSGIIAIRRKHLRDCATFRINHCRRIAIKTTSFQLRPADKPTLDGTFWVDKDGKPYMVYCYEWLQALDERFIEVTKELNETASLSKSNMDSFNESTKALNEWVRKQRNFVDGVQLLIAKLEELNKIRDYSEQFWQGTKDKMEEGVGIITRGSQTLNSQLTSLDRQFYGRLSATLSELDNCITKMVEQVGKRR